MPRTRNVEPRRLWLLGMSDARWGRVGPIGLDPQRSVLFAQVMDAKPKMSYDEEGVMHPFGTKGAVDKVFLGDVARASLRSMGTREPARFTQNSVYDEQTWELVCSNDELEVRISSRHYWGFGLFARCFLNEVVIEGPLPTRARCALDIAASLGRNPWEPTRVRAFERATSGSISAHTSCWEELISLAREGMSDEITMLQDSVHGLRGLDGASEDLLDSAEESLDRAREALADKNAPAVERALSRASSDIIRADPNSGVGSADRELLGD